MWNFCFSYRHTQLRLQGSYYSGSKLDTFFCLFVCLIDLKNEEEWLVGMDLVCSDPLSILSSITSLCAEILPIGYSIQVSRVALPSLIEGWAHNPGQTAQMVSTGIWLWESRNESTTGRMLLSPSVAALSRPGFGSFSESPELSWFLSKPGFWAALWLNKPPMSS